MYTIGQLWSEVEIVRDRLNARTVSDATVNQAVAGSVQSKKGFKHFKDLIRKLSDG